MPVHNSPLLRSLWSTAAAKSHPFSSSRNTLIFSSATATASSSSPADASDTVVDPSRLRNVAVTSQVDRGNTTLMDRLLRQCGTDIPHERALDPITLERERGISIASRVTSIPGGNEQNMVETPGHADFGGEISLAHYASSQVNLEESIREAVKTKAFAKIPELLNASKKSYQNPNPFSFLSTFSESHRIRIIDGILQSFIYLRPRFRPRLAYSSLLSYTLEGPNPLPLALAIVQRMLRSGCLPAPQTHLTLSKAWLHRRNQSHTVDRILSEMNSIGYSPDCGTCNYLILSLCKVDHIAEAVEVLRGMGRVGCILDLDSYGTLIAEMSELRMTNRVVETVKEMVGVHLLNPRKETVVKAVNAMRANREIWRAVEIIEFLESEGVGVGFEAYESVLEGCLEVCQFVLAGKFVIKMMERGFIPYIRVRQRVFEGLVTIGETELASVVRQRFAELKS